MMSFFKSFGKGIIYLLTLPVVLIVLAFYAVMGIFIFLFLMIKSCVLFFMGKTIFNDFPEDVKVKEILSPKKPEDEVEVIEPEEDSTSSAFTHTYFQGADTRYPIYEEKPAEEIEISEPEMIEEVIEETPVEETVESPLFEEEPEISDEISVGKDDMDLERYDIGASRIKKDDDDEL